MTKRRGPAHLVGAAGRCTLPRAGCSTYCRATCHHCPSYIDKPFAATIRPVRRLLAATVCPVGEPLATTVHPVGELFAATIHPIWELLAATVYPVDIPPAARTY